MEKGISEPVFTSIQSKVEIAVDGALIDHKNGLNCHSGL